MGFPEYLVIDDFLSDEDFAICEKEIKDNKHKKIPQKIASFGETFASFKRWYPDPSTPISNIIKKNLYSSKVKNLTKNFKDSSWVAYNTEILDFEVQITSYEKKRQHRYVWHIDSTFVEGSKWKGLRVLNYIIYMKDIKKGGHLQLSSYRGSFETTHRNYPIMLSVKPKRNRIAIMPSWYLHRVMPVLSGQERLSVNGHMYSRKKFIVE